MDEEVSVGEGLLEVARAINRLSDTVMEVFESGKAGEALDGLASLSMICSSIEDAGIMVERGLDGIKIPESGGNRS